MGLHTWRGRPERLLSSRERLPKQGVFRLERLRLRHVKIGPGVVRRHIWRTPTKQNLFDLSPFTQCCALQQAIFKNCLDLEDKFDMHCCVSGHDRSHMHVLDGR